MTAGFPTYCGYARAGVGCTQLAVVLIQAPGRAVVACTGHRADRTKWAAGAGTVRITPVTQPGDATPGNGQGSLLDLLDAS